MKTFFKEKIQQEIKGFIEENGFFMSILIVVMFISGFFFLF